MGPAVTGMAILSTPELPPAAIAQQAGAVAISDGWTSPLDACPGDPRPAPSAGHFSSHNRMQGSLPAPHPKRGVVTAKEKGGKIPPFYALKPFRDRPHPAPLWR
jgi:hypothetical protein